MAINDSVAGKQTQQTQKPQFAQTQQPQQTQTNMNQQPQGKWSFHQGNVFGRPPIGRGVGSETLAKLQEALTVEYKQANPEAEITLIPIDNTSEVSLAFSALVICLRYKNDINLGVAYHTLIVEATGDKIQPKFDQINNTQVEIYRVAGDACDPILLSLVAEKVRTAFPQNHIFSAEACVVPRDFNIEDKIAVHQLALNAGLADSTELDVRQPGFTDIDLASAAHDSNLEVTMNFSHQQIQNAVSEPVRSDVIISFTSRQNDQSQKNVSLNSGDRTSRIAELTGFVDLVWAPVAQQNAYNPYVAPVAQNTQKYGARLVLTSMYSTYAVTPPAQLLALVTALSVRDDNNWIQAFKPTQTPTGEDMHDIGAVGYEANFEGNPTGFGSPINTKLDTFRPENLGQLVGAVIRPGLTISLDVPECGPETWYSSIFAAASNGSVEATEALYNAANQLTHGNFGRYFTPGSEMFNDRGNRIHTGYYLDKNGKRDIRDIDYLAVMNMMGSRDPAAIKDWSDTFTQYQFPLAQRLAARKRTIMGLTGQSAVFTGFAQRVTFTDAFLDALAKGCKDAGLNVNIISPLTSGIYNNERGVANFISSTASQAGQASVFSRNFGAPAAAAGGYFAQSPRWAR